MRNVKTIRNVKIALAAGVLSVLMGCGSSMYLSKTVDVDLRGGYKLAILPFYGELPAPSDTLFSLVYADTTGVRQLVPPSTTRRRIDADEMLQHSLYKICMKDYTKEDGAKTFYMTDLISDDELVRMRALCDHADVVLIPVRFFVGPHMWRLFGITQFRLYDLHTGRLIYDVNEDRNTDLGYDGLDRQLTLELIAISFTDFERYFLRPEG